MSQMDVVLHDPLPLVHPERRLAVLWSAKAGSVFALRWFLYQTNMLEAANFLYPDWVHDFRERVLYPSPAFQKGLENILRESYTSFKFTRNPFQRAVSSYIHALKYGYEDARMSAFFNRPISGAQGFSFETFVIYLGSIDLQSCNLHHKLQRSEFEARRFRPTHVVHLESSAEELPELERQHGLRSSPMDEFRKSHHITNRGTSTEFCGNRVFTNETDAFPEARCFYDERLQNAVVTLYRADFDAYGYPKTFQ